MVGGGISQAATLKDIIVPEAGDYEITLHGIGVPEKPVVEEVTFTLKDRMILPENIIWDRIEANFNSMFIADHAEQFDESSTFRISVDGNQETIMGVTELINKFAPILHFSEGEDYPGPYAVDQIVDSANIENLADSNSYIDINQTPTERAVYASVLENPNDPNQLAINYHFFYPMSNWGEHDGANTHPGDWEGVTLFLERSGDGAWSPKELAMAQHIDFINNLNVPLYSGDDYQNDGGDKILWNDPSLVKDGSHPNLFSGTGGHATYSYAGITSWITQGGMKQESHIGDGYVYHSSGGVIYLSRIGEAFVSNQEWIAYVGKWGAPDSFGSGGINGPLVLNSAIFSDGSRQD